MMNAAELKAQKSDKTADANVTERIAKDFGVSKERAEELRSAMHLNNKEIETLVQDKTMQPAVKRDKLRKLVEARQQRLDAMMTVAEKAKMQQLTLLRKAEAEGRHKEELKRHEKEMKRVPHKSTPKSDSGKPVQ